MTNLCRAASAALFLAPTVVWGLGVRVTDHDAQATARGGAVVATADNPSAIYYNPAGIAQLEGTRALLGSYAISLEASVSGLAGGVDLDSKFEYQNAPYSFYTWKPPGSAVVLGLGVYSPFGFGLEYPDSAPFRTLATKGKIQFITINPVLAWKITDTLSVAAGPMVNYARAKLARGTPFNVPGDEFIFEGEGVGYGFNAGVLWSPHRMHSFGATYRSATTIDLSGHSRVKIPGFSVATEFGALDVERFSSEVNSNLEFNFPQTITVGYSFRPTPDWNFEFDIDWTDWDSLNTLTVQQQRAVLPFNTVVGDVALPFNWESSFLYAFGATRKLPRGLSVSAGYIYSENSIPDESFNPLVPDSNRHVLSLGVGQQLEHLSWDLAYQYAYGPHRTIDNGTLADGTYRFQSHALTLSVGYRF